MACWANAFASKLGPFKAKKADVKLLFCYRFEPLKILKIIDTLL
jgi:hypothetical protein